MSRILHRRVERIVAKHEARANRPPFVGLRIFESIEDYETWFATEEGQQQGDRSDPTAPFTGLTLIGHPRMEMTVAEVTTIPPQDRARG
jgi:hypothetical protein